MGLTKKSMGFNLKESEVYKDNESDIIVALMGNPNVGKSTIFNALTGLNQHTGNWTGKTVAKAIGKFNYNDEDFILVDLPGTYSLSSDSKEEEIARDFICYSKPMVTVVVVDATSLERNLNLVLQITELTNNVVLCVNLIDEAEKKNICIDIEALEKELNIPVIKTSARSNNGLDKLVKCIYKYSIYNTILPNRIKYNDEIENSISVIKSYLDKIFEKLYNDNYNFLDEFELDEYEASEFTSQSKRLKRIIKRANNIKEGVELPAIHKFKPTRKQRKIDKIYDGIRLFVSEDDEQGIIELYLVDLYHLAIDSENYSIGTHDLNRLYKSKEDFSKCISKTSDKYI